MPPEMLLLFLDMLSCHALFTWLATCVMPELTENELSGRMSMALHTSC